MVTKETTPSKLSTKVDVDKDWIAIAAIWQEYWDTRGSFRAMSMTERDALLQPYRDKFRHELLNKPAPIDEEALFKKIKDAKEASLLKNVAELFK